MDLITVLSFALVYNGQELKKYQQMLIKENISLDSFAYQLIKVEQTGENTDQNNNRQNEQNNNNQNNQNNNDNNNQNNQNNNNQNDQNNNRQDNQNNNRQNEQNDNNQNNNNNNKQNNRNDTKQDTGDNLHWGEILGLVAVAIASIFAVGYLIHEFINHAFTIVTTIITSSKILILAAIIALAYIYRDTLLYWIAVKTLKEQKSQQQQDNRQNRDRRDRFNENREHRNHQEQKYDQLVKQRIETLPRLVIAST
jgi:phage-related minor tail protein